MQYTPIGKSQFFEYCDMYFELSENIQQDSFVILVDYRHQLVLLSVVSEEPIDKVLIQDFIPTMPGFSYIKDSPIGKINSCFVEEDKLFYIDVDLAPLVFITIPGYLYCCQIPSVIITDELGRVYSFRDSNFEYYLRNIKSTEAFMKQINQIIPY